MSDNDRKKELDGAAPSTGDGEDSQTPPTVAQELSKQEDENQTSTSSPRSKSGWDGKLRVERKPVITNPEALEDSDYSDEDAPPVDVIEADEGT